MWDVCTKFSEHAQDKSKLTPERLFSCDCLEAHKPKTTSITKTTQTILLWNSVVIHISIFGYIFRFIYILSRFRIPSMGNPRKRRCKGSAIHIAALKSDSELLERLLDMQVSRFCREFFSLGSHGVPMGFPWFPAFLKKRKHERGLWGKICQVGQWVRLLDSNWSFQVPTSFCWNQLQTHHLESRSDSF